MDGWWRRDPFFVRYMAREASAFFLAAYALILLWGVWSLRQGAGAYDAWLAALRNPIAILFHLVALAFVTYHAYTWWQVAPKTMPTLRLGGKEVPQAAIAAGGIAATLLATVATLALVAWGTR
jgi:fumarate reductase subunit C